MADNVVNRANEWLGWAQDQFRDQLQRAQAHLTVDGPGVKPTLPPKSLFQFPPANLPTTLPPPLKDSSFANPFQISPELYNAALSPAVPITFALVYVTVITYLNSVNVRRDKKPWAISRTALFKLFVLVHNIFLSGYSLWTFLGMLNALRVSIVDPREYGLAATVDSFCKINGPRGHGSAATYSADTGTWGILNREYHLGSDGLNPDSTDVGRIWNEGLAFYGWLFYLSKFYEVIDTLIIIAKGKKSSFLQTYHHAGAMLAMWAGIRYMSPPIWMFVTVNSFIHFVMYAFYTATTLGIKVPKPLKQTLTTLQITQFVVGAIYAFAHYFVAYEIPVQVPYIFRLVEAVGDAATAIQSDATSALSVATATASADLGSWLKKLALRAAGREGMAENVLNEFGQTFGIDAVHAAKEFTNREVTRYRDELQWVHCLDTSGQSFAIYLNVLYLAPLTWLFLQFFIKSYIKRVDDRRRSSASQKAAIAGQSMSDASKGVARRLSEAFEHYQGANGEADGDEGLDPTAIRAEAKEIAKKAQDKGQEVAQKAKELTTKVKQKAEAALKKEDEQTSGDKLESDPKQEKTTSEPKSEATSSSTSTGTDKASGDMDAKTQTKPVKDKDEVRTPKKSSSKEPVSGDKADDEGWSVQKSVENLINEDTTSNAADTAEKVKKEADEIGDRIASKISKISSEPREQSTGDGEKTAEHMKEKVETDDVDVKEEKEVEKKPSVEEDTQKDDADHTNNSVGKGEIQTTDDHLKELDPISEATEAGTSTEPVTADYSHELDIEQQADGDAHVQKGKTFADVAAEPPLTEDNDIVEIGKEADGTDKASHKDDEGV